MSIVSYDNESVKLTVETAIQMISDHPNKPLKDIAERYGVNYTLLRVYKQRAIKSGRLVKDDNGRNRRANTVEKFERYWLDETNAHTKTKKALQEAQDRIADLEAQIRAMKNTPVNKTEVKEAIASATPVNTEPQHTQQKKYGFGEISKLITMQDIPEDNRVAEAPVVSAKETNIKTLEAVMKASVWTNANGEKVILTDVMKSKIRKIQQYKQMGYIGNAKEEIQRMTTGKFAAIVPLAEQFLSGEIT